jgi:hypothetical protein
MRPQRLFGLFAVGLAFAVQARAQSETSISGFELNRLGLDPSGMGSLVMGSARLMQPGTFRAAAALSYANDPLGVVWNGTRVGSFIRDRVSLELAGAFSLHDRIEVAAVLPIVLVQLGDDLSAYGIVAPAVAGLGSPWVSARTSILEDGELIPFDLGAQLGVGVPVGSADALASSPGFAISPELFATKALGGLLATGGLGLTLRPSVPLGVEQVGSDLTIGAAVVYAQPPGFLGRFVPEAALKMKVPLTGQGPALEALVGGRLPFGSGWNAFALAGFGFGRAPGTPLFTVSAGASFDNAGGAPKPARRTKGQPTTVRKSH